MWFLILLLLVQEAYNLLKVSFVNNLNEYPYFKHECRLIIFQFSFQDLKSFKSSIDKGESRWPYTQIYTCLMITNVDLYY